MADEDEAPEGAENQEGGAEAAAETKKKTKSGGGGFGPLLALLLVFVLAVVLVLGVLSLLGGASEETTEDEGPVEIKGALTELAQVVPLGDVMANVKGEAGRRYVKVTVDAWVYKDQMTAVNKPELINIMRQAMEERLSTYSMTSLNETIKHTSMRRAFEDEVNKELRRVMGTEGTDTVYIHEIVLTNLLIQ